MNRSKKTRLAVLVTHPIQYYAPLYRALAANDRIDVTVIFLTDAGVAEYHDPGFQRSFAWDVPLLGGYSYRILEPGHHLSSSGFWKRYSHRLVSVLDELSPDFILVYGYASRMNWSARLWASKNGARLVYYSDSNSEIPKSVVRGVLKRLVVGSYFKGIELFLSPSEANESYLRRFNAPSERIIRCPFAIDYSRWSAYAVSVGTSRPNQFVWAGKFVPRKRPLDFVRALSVVGQNVPAGVDALVVGDGPLMGEVRAAVHALPSSARVTLTGFVNQKDMPSVLSQADSLVFTSEREPYGLIATEASAVGLSLIVAEGIGCVGDTVLARPEVNALTFPPGDIGALAGAMIRLSTDASLRRRMQRASMEIAKEHDVSVAAATIENALLTMYEEKVERCRYA